MPHTKKHLFKGLIRPTAAISLLLVLMLVLASCGGAKALATYKGGKVTQTDFDKLIAFAKFNMFLSTGSEMYDQLYDQLAAQSETQKSMIKQIVAYRILSDEAGDQVKKDGKESAKAQMPQIQSFVDSQLGGFSTVLKKYKLSEKDVENMISQSIIAMGYMQSKITDDQIQAEYDKMIAEDNTVFRIATVRHILIALTDPNTNKELRTKDEALQIAQEVQAKLNNGESFDDLAKEYSDDEGSKDTGGKYENVPLEQWTAGFKEAVAELPLDTISDPVESDYGYHVIKVEARSTQPLSDVKDQVVTTLASDQINEFMESGLTAYALEFHLPTPEPADDNSDDTGNAVDDADNTADDANNTGADETDETSDSGDAGNTGDTGDTGDAAK